MDDPNMHAYGEDGPDDAELGRQWREDSSLKRWFPITAERLAALESENAALKATLAPSVGADGLPWQGGMSNAELLAAWSEKLPGVTPSDRELSAFALGAEAGFARARELERADWNRVHHALKDAGVHPGRTDDHLADVIASALASRPVGDKS